MNTEDYIQQFREDIYIPHDPECNSCYVSTVKSHEEMQQWYKDHPCNCGVDDAKKEIESFLRSTITSIQREMAWELRTYVFMIQKSVEEANTKSNIDVWNTLESIIEKIDSLQSPVKEEGKV